MVKIQLTQGGLRATKRLRSLTEVMVIFVYPRRLSAAIFDFIEQQIVPFDPPTPQTLAWNQTWSGSDALFAR